LFRQFRKALWLALEHDVLNTAKAAAYSGMLTLFPALVVTDRAAGPGAGGHLAGGRGARRLRAVFARRLHVPAEGRAGKLAGSTPRS